MSFLHFFICGYKNGKSEKEKRCRNQGASHFRAPGTLLTCVSAWAYVLHPPNFQSGNYHTPSLINFASTSSHSTIGNIYVNLTAKLVEWIGGLQKYQIYIFPRCYALLHITYMELPICFGFDPYLPTFFFCLPAYLLAKMCVVIYLQNVVRKNAWCA